VRASGEPWRLKRGGRGFPEALAALQARVPNALWGVGDRDLVAGLKPPGTVTIVGARRASAYGCEVAEELGRNLAAAGLVVVSGMARGIDAAAHRGALAAGGLTVAVLAGGPDFVYPAGEGRLYRRILESGAVVSEHPPGTRPLGRWSFPDRNRIMAALGGMTVVVEAAERSGSSITAGEAADCGRTVGAVPGNVTSWLSAGTNKLIFDGARTIRDAQDVLDELVGVGEVSVRGAGPDLEPQLRRVLDAVERGAATCDGAALAAGLAGRDASIALARLELLGYLRADIAGRYARTTLAAPARG
jgi:DNA processing protein